LALKGAIHLQFLRLAGVPEQVLDSG
jgi:hypothetical protein